MSDGIIEKLSEEWSCNSTETLKLALVDADGTEHPFEPVFTYPIFGDSETIYGYKNLAMSLKFDSSSLLPLLSISWEAKLPVEIEDPETVFRRWLPKTIDTDISVWNEKRKDADTIPGEKKDTFTDSDGTEFTIYRTSFKDKAGKQIHSRMEIFVLLFIEAGGYIDDADEHWEVYLLFQTSPKGGKVDNKSFKPMFAGYSTIYKYFWYKDAIQHDAPNGTDPYMPLIRKRISQFVVLPLYQGKRVGGGFYGTLFNICYADPLVVEVLVEDPSEAFDDMRDRVDLSRLLYNGTAKQIVNAFSRTTLVDGVIREHPEDASKPEFEQELTLEWIKNKRSENKMSTRQFDRCIEMILLNHFDDLSKSAKGKGKGTSVKELNLSTDQKRFRLLVKRRLYLRNKDALDDLPVDDRKSKLQETYESIKDDYRRITKKVNFKVNESEKRKADDKIVSSHSKRTKK